MPLQAEMPSFLGILPHQKTVVCLLFQRLRGLRNRLLWGQTDTNWTAKTLKNTANYQFEWYSTDNLTKLLPALGPLAQFSQAVRKSSFHCHALEKIDANRMDLKHLRLWWSKRGYLDPPPTFAWRTYRLGLEARQWMDTKRWFSFILDIQDSFFNHVLNPHTRISTGPRDIWSSDSKPASYENQFDIFWGVWKSNVAIYAGQNNKPHRRLLLTSFCLLFDVIPTWYCASHRYDVQDTNKAMYGHSQSCPHQCNGSILIWASCTYNLKDM